MSDGKTIKINFEKGEKLTFDQSQLVSFYSYDIRATIMPYAQVFLIFQFDSKKVRLYEIQNGEEHEINMLKRIVSLLCVNHGFKIKEKSKKYSHNVLRDWEIFEYYRTVK
ncbi:hypothetical protein GCM10022393_36090 [Aquimarina addita]|uniref:Uncharacterized protein n=2 Tax=Aquimarina addita TaxID=870485 RepID=A0ABP6UUW0_9FLAO